MDSILSYMNLGMAILFACMTWTFIKKNESIGSIVTGFVMTIISIANIFY